MIPSSARLLVAAQILMFASSVSGAGFGVVTEKDHHVVDTGAGLVFRVVKSTGDIDSIQWRGTELNERTRDSGIASGLGPKGTTTRVQAGSDLAMVTVRTDASNGVIANCTHYFIVRKGDNTIYMATHAEKQPGVGELRWITRLQGDLFPEVPEESNNRNNTGKIESKDVAGMADGTTRSKYYGNDQARHLTMRGVTGPGRGVFMVYGNRESSSGGPFFRDIQFQSGSSAEVYNYMNSGHAQTEMKRSGVLYGPYALCFTNGEKPALPDMSFISGLGLTGQVTPERRGRIAVRLLERDPNHEYTVGFASPTAQYWAVADPGHGGAVCSGMKPGAYRMTVYKGELGIHTATVKVTAGLTLRQPDITLEGDPSRVAPLWRIGDWDGAPLEFRNGKNISLMHPSDKRQVDWTPGPFTVGSSKPTDFPSCQWMKVNSGQLVNFKLSAAQITDAVVRIGITTAHSAARPRIRVNSWTSRIPAPSAQADSRGLTIGTYRGNNRMHSFDVPAKALVAGENTMEISVASGSGGDGFLSPGYAIDCVDMHPKQSR